VATVSFVLTIADHRRGVREAIRATLMRQKGHRFDRGDAVLRHAGSAWFDFMFSLRYHR
jgi:hypothetical protein